MRWLVIRHTFTLSAGGWGPVTLYVGERLPIDEDIKSDGKWVPESGYRIIVERESANCFVSKSEVRRNCTIENQSERS